MIGSTRAVSVWAFREPVDMRRSFDGLSALVSQSMGRDPLSGDMYLFVGRNRRRAKVLLWDGTGLCVYAKRLEKGLFSAPWSSDGDELRLSMSELSLLLEGARIVERLPLSPEPWMRERAFNPD